MSPFGSASQFNTSTQGGLLNTIQQEHFSVDSKDIKSEFQRHSRTASTGYRDNSTPPISTRSESPIASSLQQRVVSDPSKIIFSSSPRARKALTRPVTPSSEGFVKDFINWATKSSSRLIPESIPLLSKKTFTPKHLPTTRVLVKHRASKSSVFSSSTPLSYKSKSIFSGQKIDSNHYTALPTMDLSLSDSISEADSDSIVDHIPTMENAPSDLEESLVKHDLLDQYSIVTSIGDQSKNSDDAASTQELQKRHARPESPDSISETTEPKGPEKITINDASNFLLLIFLYMFQGIPFGLAFGTIPFLLKSASQTSGASYTEIGIFSFASYPYTFKLLWSPIVDAFFFKKFGKRKSWIVPMQLCIGLMFLWMGQNIESFMFRNPPQIYPLTAAFILLIVFCATQDIAVDGWALTILSRRNVRYGSLAQTIGLNAGYFLSFTIFLAFYSVDFCKKYFYFLYHPEDLEFGNTLLPPHGLVSLGGFLTFCGVFCLILTLFVIFKKEESSKTHKESLSKLSILSQAYMNIMHILYLPWMPTFVLILLIHKFGYMANEILTPLKLIEKGFRKEDLAIIALIDFPFQMLFGWATIKWSKGSRPMRPWLYATYIRILMTAFGMLVVAYYPTSKDSLDSWGYFLAVLAITLTTSLMSTMMFVSQGAFFNVISDPSVGGTFTTFLHTFSNFGGTWPRYFILKAVDLFSDTKCILKQRNAAQAVYSCSTESEKLLCKKLSGDCLIITDGYYLVCGVCMICGLLVLVLFVNRKILTIEALPESNWRLPQDSSHALKEKDGSK
jgi:PAT family acetyl-CoA transporter-like MFS transporter 1